jgi:hypothetical protein
MKGDDKDKDLWNNATPADLLAWLQRELQLLRIVYAKRSERIVGAQQLRWTSSSCLGCNMSLPERKKQNWLRHEYPGTKSQNWLRQEFPDKNSSRLAVNGFYARICDEFTPTRLPELPLGIEMLDRRP